MAESTSSAASEEMGDAHERAERVAGATMSPCTCCSHAAAGAAPHAPALTGRLALTHPALLGRRARPEQPFAPQLQALDQHGAHLLALLCQQVFGRDDAAVVVKQRGRLLDRLAGSVEKAGGRVESTHECVSVAAA